MRRVVSDFTQGWMVFWVIAASGTISERVGFLVAMNVFMLAIRLLLDGVIWIGSRQ
jgi:hypothetical protein